MKKLLLAAVVVFGIGAITLLVLLNHFKNNDSAYTVKGHTSKKVHILKQNGRYQLYNNGKPFLVKGAAGVSHIAELAAAGGNTIVLWDTAILQATLDEAQRYNVSVIVGLDIPGGNFVDYYKNSTRADSLFKLHKGIVNRYKNHPALLAWCLGNELAMPYTIGTSLFYQTYKRCLDMMHTDDPDHPVTTTIINYNKGSLLNSLWRIQDLDFISLNVYNQLKEMRSQLDQLEILWNGPYLITEWAPNGGWEAERTSWHAPIENTSTKKAEMYYDYYSTYMPKDDPRFLGSMVFYWGARQEYTHTWFSIFDESGAPTEIEEVLNDCWKNTLTDHEAVKVKYMVVDNMGARDNIIVSPGSKHKASLFLADNESTDSLRYHWELLQEDWLHWDRTWSNFVKPVPITGLIADSSNQSTVFTAPLKEGPYRIFITVFNKKGYCATANTPFYVVE